MEHGLDEYLPFGWTVGRKSELVAKRVAPVLALARTLVGRAVVDELVGADSKRIDVHLVVVGSE